MKAIFVGFIIITFGLIACHKTTLLPNEDLSALHKRFHGKYKPITSTSNEAIDVNLDGTASKDILSEIPDMSNANLEILIYENDTPLFTQFLQEQYFLDNIRSNTYNSNLVVNYVKQCIGRLFKFDSNIKQINLNPDKDPQTDSIHFPFPRSVVIQINDRIEVISAKQLFTRSGWEKVEITTVYERFTKVT